MTKLLTIEQAAKLLNVPKGSLRAAAEEHGFLVRMGRAVRIDQDQLGDLVERCKQPPVSRSVKHLEGIHRFSDDREAYASAMRAADALKKLGKRKKTY